MIISKFSEEGTAAPYRSLSTPYNDTVVIIIIIKMIKIMITLIVIATIALMIIKNSDKNNNAESDSNNNYVYLVSPRVVSSGIDTYHSGLPCNCIVTPVSL